MKLTPEQLKILIDGLREHDFTASVPLPEPDANGKIPPRNYTPFEKRVLIYMKSNLLALGITRYMGNFSGNSPVNLLMDADARYISDESMKILSDAERTDAAVDQFFELFGNLIEQVADSYCKAKDKKQDDLTDEEIQLILDRTTDVINEELTSVLMQGQQFPALNDAAHEMPAHEDFGDKFNLDAVNFHNQWTHCKTAVGEMLSLDEQKSPDPDSETYHNEKCEPMYDAAYELDPVFQVMCKAFCETMNDTDLTLFQMREDGYTQAEIAEKLGYKSQGAVAKRLQKLKNRWDEFMDEPEPKKE